MTSARTLLLSCAVVVGCCPGSAEASGGYFATSDTMVTDHRMAFAVSKDRTVLWDQIRVTGATDEFAWILPVRPGSKMELGHDEFLTALAKSTTPVVWQPGLGEPTTGCASCDGSDDSYDDQTEGRGVANYSVIGPYETVTLHTPDVGTLRSWLAVHHYTVAPAVAAVLDAYVAAQYDFIAARFRPGCGDFAMQPIRVISPGVDLTLPMRMLAVGSGARASVRLWVIAERRIEPENFPVGTINDDDLRFGGPPTDYLSIADSVMSSASGRTWLMEDSRPARIQDGIWSAPTSYAYDPAPPLPDAYFAHCNSLRDASATSCTQQKLGLDADITDADVADADAGDAGDAGDAEVLDADVRRPAAPSLIAPYGCEALDDLDVALEGMHRRDAWVTRLRANLPVEALTEDLRLHAPAQTEVTNVHVPYDYAPPLKSDGLLGCAGGGKRRAGTWPVAVALAFVGLAVVRRKRW